MLLAVLAPTGADHAAPVTKGGAVNVVVDAVLGVDGSLKGTLTSTWSAACAAELSGRLMKLEPSQRSAALAAMAGPPLTGHLNLATEIKGLGQTGADLVVTYTLDAPRFAPAEGPGKVPGLPLSLGLPFLSPYDPLKVPAALLPVVVNHDITIKLPPSTVPLEIPSAFSTVTPDAGRYVLWFDLAKAATVVVKARRELEITGASPARLGELAEGVASHDATRLTIVASKPAASSG